MPGLNWRRGVQGCGGQRAEGPRGRLGGLGMVSEGFVLQTPGASPGSRARSESVPAG